LRSGYSFPDLADLEGEDSGSFADAPASFAGLSGREDAPTASVLGFEEVEEDALTRVARPKEPRAPAPAFSALDAPPIVTGDNEELVFTCATTPLDESKPAGNVRASRASFSDEQLSPLGPTKALRPSASSRRSEARKLEAPKVEVPEKKASRLRLDLTMRSRKADIERAVQNATVLVTEPVGHPVVPVVQVTATPAPAPTHERVAAVAPARYPTAQTPATTVAAYRSSRASRPDDTGPRPAPPMRGAAPSEPAWSESPWVLSSSPSQPHFQADLLPPPQGAMPPRPRIDLSMVGAIATGAVAFCLILGAFFFTRQSQPLPLEDTANAASIPVSVDGNPAVPVPVEGTTSAATSPANALVPPPPATGTAKSNTAPPSTNASFTSSEGASSNAGATDSQPRPARKPKLLKTDDSPRSADSEKPPKPSSSASASSASSSSSSSSSSSTSSTASASGSKKKGSANGPKSLEQILDELGEEQLRR
jgi:hypothetical protein